MKLVDRMLKISCCCEWIVNNEKLKLMSWICEKIKKNFSKMAFWHWTCEANDSHQIVERCVGPNTGPKLVWKWKYEKKWSQWNSQKKCCYGGTFTKRFAKLGEIWERQSVNCISRVKIGCGARTYPWCVGIVGVILWWQGSWYWDQMFVVYHRQEQTIGLPH